MSIAGRPGRSILLSPLGAEGHLHTHSEYNWSTSTPLHCPTLPSLPPLNSIAPFHFFLLHRNTITSPMWELGRSRKNTACFNKTSLPGSSLFFHRPVELGSP